MHRKTRRVVLVTGLLTLLVVVGLLGSLEGFAADKEIVMLYNPDPFWEEEAKLFTEKTGIHVRFEFVPFMKLHDKMLTTFMAGAADYDIVPTRDDWVAEFAPRGFLTPLDQWLTPEIRGRYLPGSLNALSWSGKTYGAPLYVWIWQLYYNKEALAAAGYSKPPQTWAEVLEMAPKLTKGGQYAWGEPWGENFAHFPFMVRLWTEGGEFLTEDGKPAFNSPEGLRALEKMIRLKPYVNPGSLEASSTGPVAESFIQGIVAMTINTPPTIVMSLDKTKSKVAGKVGVSLIPGSAVRSATLAETGSLGIPAMSRKKELAWQFIQFLTSDEEQKKMAKAMGRMPNNVRAIKDPELLSMYPHFAVVPEQLEYPSGMLKHPKAQAIGNAVSRHIVLALQGRETPAEALAKAEKEVLALTQ
ncbi:MAG: ABC transporter substrate-binding protein [Bacteroidota bacterium]